MRSSWHAQVEHCGFTDEQLRPCAYSAAPFLTNPKAVQQGDVTEDAVLLAKLCPSRRTMRPAACRAGGTTADAYVRAKLAASMDLKTAA